MWFDHHPSLPVNITKRACEMFAAPALWCLSHLTPNSLLVTLAKLWFLELHVNDTPCDGQLAGFMLLNKQDDYSFASHGLPFSSHLLKASFCQATLEVSAHVLVCRTAYLFNKAANQVVYWLSISPGRWGWISVLLTSIIGRINDLVPVYSV